MRKNRLREITVVVSGIYNALEFYPIPQEYYTLNSQVYVLSQYLKHPKFRQ